MIIHRLMTIRNNLKMASSDIELLLANVKERYEQLSIDDREHSDTGKELDELITELEAAIGYIEKAIQTVGNQMSAKRR